jgi:predicted secreted protein
MNPLKLSICGFFTGLAIVAARPAVAGIDVHVQVGEPKLKINAYEGENFVINLPAHGWRDYAWQLVDSSDKVQLVGKSVCATQDFNAGHCQSDQWTFHAVDKGKGTLRFQYVNLRDATQVGDYAAFRVHVHR